MLIRLGTRYTDSIIVFVHPNIYMWLGFLKVDLLNSEKDAIDIFKGKCLFALPLVIYNITIKVIGKAEKAFDLTTSKN